MIIFTVASNGNMEREILSGVTGNFGPRLGFVEHCLLSFLLLSLPFYGAFLEFEVAENPIKSSKTLQLSKFWHSGAPEQKPDREAANAINVCCLKWGNKYNAEYVNRLAAMVRRNLKTPHRFVCFTDDPAGIHASIECRPLLDEGMTGWWHKISFFRPEIYDLHGTLLFLDLDTVIVSRLELFFEYTGNFCIIRDWLSPRSFNSSVFRMEIGTKTHVYNNFLKFGPEKAAKHYPGDQEWISEQITDATLWPESWCVSFKWQCALPSPSNPIIPDGAKIVVFHGKPDPHEAMNNSYRIYGPKHLVPHDNLWGNPASWIDDFWNVGETLGPGDSRPFAPTSINAEIKVSDTAPPPPLNPSRFAKLDLPALSDHARKWFPLDSAFAMCLNAAIMRGAGASFAAELAGSLTQAPLEQAFYLYRTGERIKQAMEMAAGPIAASIRAGQPLPGIVLDAVAATKAHDRALHKMLLQKIVAAKPDLKMSPTINAFLQYEIEETLGAQAAEALNSVPGNGEMFEGEICIAGITKVRNEGEIVPEYIGYMLEYCDFVLIFGHVPDDGGPEAAQAKFGAERVEIILRPDMEVLNDKTIYDALFLRARERKATHFIMVDADETLGPALANPLALREQARYLRPGETLTVPFPQVFGDGLADYGKFAALNDLSRLLPPWKDLLYCDDGKALHRDMPVHNPWLPEGFPLRRKFISDTSAGLLHFEKANPLNALIKTDYYIAKELVQYRTPLPIVLSRYLPAHLVHNAFWDTPPVVTPMAAAPHTAYTRLGSWQLKDTLTFAPQIPPELRFLFNLDYWS